MSPALRHCALPVAASLGLHGLLVVLAAAWLMVPPLMWGTRVPSEATMPEQETEDVESVDLAAVEVTFIPEEELLKPLPEKSKLPETNPPGREKPPTRIHVVASEDMPALAAIESETPFISDRNLRASSASAPAPNADPLVPNQEGVELSGISLFNAQPASGSLKPQPRPSPPVVAAQTPPEPEQPESMKDRPPETASVVPTDDPSAPAPPADTPKTPAMRERPPDPLALSEVQPRPAPKPNIRPPEDPDPQSTKGQAAGPRPVVSSVKTKITGGVANQGQESSVDARDTPEGRFLSAMHDRIGLLWNSRLAMNRGIAGTGSVEVEFDIDIRSRISNVRLVDPGKANPILEDICLTSVIKAKLPPLPPSMKREVQDPLNGGKIRRKVTFHRL